MGIRGALPDTLKVWWFFCSPIALPFTVRIVWEKTVWTWSRGPQMVGFSLMHIHPMFAIVGFISSLSVMLWLLPAMLYSIVRRRRIGIMDVAMITCAIFVTFAIVTPDNFFA